MDEAKNIRSRSNRPGCGPFLMAVVCILAFFHCPFAKAQEDSKEAEALFVAQKAFDDGFYDVALSLLDRFQKNYPSSQKTAEVNLLLGQCYFHQNKFLEALKKFEDILDEPGAKEIKDAVLYWIAEVHFKGNNFSKAASYYKMIVEGFPQSQYLASAYYSLGWCLFQEGYFKDALENFKNVEQKFPQHPQVQESGFKIIECLYNLKDYAALKERLKSYLKSASKDASKTSYLYFYLAEADYYLNNFNDAIEEYEKTIQGSAEPKIQALAGLGMGWGYLKLKQYAKAEEAFLAVNPDSLEKRSQEVLYLGKAVLYFETNRFQEAKNIYDSLISGTSEPVVLLQAYLGKADTLYNLNDYQESIKTYREASEKIGSKPLPGELIDKLHYGLAWAYLKEGEFKQAIPEFQKIVKHSEDKIFKISALCQIGDAYQDSGDLAKALQTYDSILKDYPDSFYGDYVQYQTGLTMLRLSNYEGAILSFLNFKSKFPNSKLADDAAYALGLAYFQKQDYASSREIFEKFDRDFPDSLMASQAMYLLGTSLYNLQEYSRAIEVFKNITRSFGQDTELVQRAEYEIADCYYQMGNEKESLARFNMLRAKYPDSSLTAEVMWWLGEYYYRKNDLNLAQRYFSSLIQDFPGSNLVADAYYAIGSIYTQESRYQEAVDSFTKVIELSQSDLAGQAAVALADIHAKQGKFDLATQIYQEKAQQYPNLSHLIYPKIGDIFVKQARYEDALDFYLRSLSVVPIRETADVHFKIAEVFQAQGKTGQAVEEYLKVTYLYAQDLELGIKAFLRVAKAYEDQDNFKEAVKIYRKVISLNVPESKYAQERIESIESQGEAKK